MKIFKITGIDVALRRRVSGLWLTGINRADLGAPTALGTERGVYYIRAAFADSTFRAVRDAHAALDTVLCYMKGHRATSIIGIEN